MSSRIKYLQKSAAANISTVHIKQTHYLQHLILEAEYMQIQLAHTLSQSCREICVDDPISTECHLLQLDMCRDERFCDCIEWN